MEETTEEGVRMVDDIFRDVIFVVSLDITSSSAENGSTGHSMGIKILPQIQVIRHFHRLIPLIYNQLTHLPIILSGILTVAQRTM